MRLHPLLTCITIFLSVLTHAQAQSLPSCALKCLSDTLPQSICAPTNQTCICTSTDFNAKMSSCVAANCSVKDGLTTVNTTNTECGLPVRDHTALSIIVPSVGFVVVVFIVLRLFTRLVVTKLELGWDDWTTILLGCVMVATNVGSILLGKAGLGKDIWTLEFQNIQRILYVFYVQELLYVICIVLTKICFLLFYVRIFPSVTMRWVIRASGVLTLCYGIAFLFAFSFQCSPVSFNWESWDGEHEGTCVEKNTLVVAAGALNVVLDAWVIALPIPSLLNLQASLTLRLQIIAMFSVGFLVTGVSIYRIVMLKIFATSTNPTWDNAAGGYWSIVEVDVGVFILCMPALRSLLGRLLPSVFGSTKGLSSAGRPPKQNKFKGASGNHVNTSFVQLIEMDNAKGPKSASESC
ncbi:uncharacterized protein TRUGW13939_11013 [Talaromyces rugulosus]|uniref:CFEM domain-containing protein n=1 Tax=Talaromyces rugulosus TaxID=121627 RepID=A0A7H8RBN6_TALRU|nr:uncharacterized protein TRUGW13939_11013 [Talaromyces rugulosus]QKX63842.1 hypothetical protein TRUGW13939_11013 [Talaromyces rugulosus]